MALVDSGEAGAHRWFAAGLIRFNVTMIVSPLLIIALWKINQTKGLAVPIGITLAVAVILLIQPVASQLMGFALAMTVILCDKTNRTGLHLMIIGSLSLCVVLSWVFFGSSGLGTLRGTDSKFVGKKEEFMADFGHLFPRPIASLFSCFRYKSSDTHKKSLTIGNLLRIM